MRIHMSVAAALALNFTIVAACSAKVKESAHDWQVKSLKGVTSLKYGVGWDPDNKFSKLLADGLSDLGIATKSVDLKSDTAPLGKAEARLKLVVEERDKGQNWVGLYILQNSRLDRDTAISFDGETYAAGTLVPRADTDKAVKELCAEFVHDFSGK